MDASDLAALRAQIERLEQERDQARAEAAATERQVVAAIAGDLASLGRRARAEHSERLARGEGARSEQLLHHAQAFEFVAVELARKFGAEVAEAIGPPAPLPDPSGEPAPRIHPEGPPNADEPPPPASGHAWIEID